MQSSLHRFVLAQALLLCAVLIRGATAGSVDRRALRDRRQRKGFGHPGGIGHQRTERLIDPGRSPGRHPQAGSRRSAVRLRGDQAHDQFLAERPRNASEPEHRQPGAELSTGDGSRHAADARPAAADAGPGTVHLAVRVSPDGDTCVQSLPWNASAIVVSETMGDATYQVKPDEAVLFKGGHLKQASPTKQNCGCPRWSNAGGEGRASAGSGRDAARNSSHKSAGAILPQTAQPSATQPLASAPPPEQHLSVDAPFIFHGNDAAPDLRQNVVMLKLSNAKIVNLEPTVLPPPRITRRPQPRPPRIRSPEPPKAVARLLQQGGSILRVGYFISVGFRPSAFSKPRLLAFSSWRSNLNWADIIARPDFRGSIGCPS